MPNSSNGIPVDPLSGRVLPVPGSGTDRSSLALGTRDFERLLEMQGVWFVHIRTNEGFPCTRCHVVPGSGEGESGCTTCLGTGYVASVERLKAIIAKTRRAFASDADIVPGQFMDNRPRIYVPISTRLGPTDVILEVEWNVAPACISVSGEPTEILRVYGIDVAERQYYGGEAAFVMIMAEVLDHRKASLWQAMNARAV